MLRRKSWTNINYIYMSWRCLLIWRDGGFLWNFTCTCNCVYIWITSKSLQRCPCAQTNRVGSCWPLRRINIKTAVMPLFNFFLARAHASHMCLLLWKKCVKSCFAIKSQKLVFFYTWNILKLTTSFNVKKAMDVSLTFVVTV